MQLLLMCVGDGVAATRTGITGTKCESGRSQWEEGAAASARQAALTSYRVLTTRARDHASGSGSRLLDWREARDSPSVPLSLRAFLTLVPRDPSFSFLAFLLFDVFARNLSLSLPSLQVREKEFLHHPPSSLSLSVSPVRRQ